MGGSFVTDAVDADASWRTRAASRLHPHRVPLLTLGLTAFCVAIAPVAAMLHGLGAPATWQAIWLGSWLPIVFWAIGGAVFASYFEPSQGILAQLARHPVHPRAASLWNRLADITVGGFALAPLVIWASAL